MLGFAGCTKESTGLCLVPLRLRLLGFAGRPKESTGLCLVPLMLRLLEFAGRPKESTGLCLVPLMLRLLEFAGRPKESTGLCPVPLRTSVVSRSRTPERPPRPMHSTNQYPPSSEWRRPCRSALSPACRRPRLHFLPPGQWGLLSSGGT